MIPVQIFSLLSCAQYKRLQTWLVEWYMNSLSEVLVCRRTCTVFKVFMDCLGHEVAHYSDRHLLFPSLGHKYEDDGVMLY